MALLIADTYKLILYSEANPTNIINAKVTQDGWIFITLHAKTTRLIVIKLCVKIVGVPE